LRGSDPNREANGSNLAPKSLRLWGWWFSRFAGSRRQALIGCRWRDLNHDVTIPDALNPNQRECLASYRSWGKRRPDCSRRRVNRRIRFTGDRGRNRMGRINRPDWQLTSFAAALFLDAVTGINRTTGARKPLTWANWPASGRTVARMLAAPASAWTPIAGTGGPIADMWRTPAWKPLIGMAAFIDAPIRVNGTPAISWPFNRGNVCVITLSGNFLSPRTPPSGGLLAATLFRVLTAVFLFRCLFGQHYSDGLFLIFYFRSTL